jgi:hypothetical protein
LIWRDITLFSSIYTFKCVRSDFRIFFKFNPPLPFLLFIFEKYENIKIKGDGGEASIWVRTVNFCRFLPPSDFFNESKMQQNKIVKILIKAIFPSLYFSLRG